MNQAIYNRNKKVMCDASNIFTSVFTKYSGSSLGTRVFEMSAISQMLKTWPWQLWLANWSACVSSMHAIGLIRFN